MTSALQSLAQVEYNGVVEVHVMQELALPTEYQTYGATRETLTPSGSSVILDRFTTNAGRRFAV
jgi:hypothetical protein